MEQLNTTKEKSSSQDATVPLIVFKLGNEEYGIKIEQVKEVTITPHITPMPRTPRFIRGVANIRGEIIAIIDLEEKFKINKVNAPAMPSKTYTLVVERENYSIGLVVREVPQTLSLKSGQIDRTPSILSENDISEKYIEGIGKSDGRLIIILDIFKILSFEEEQLLIEKQP